MTYSSRTMDDNVSGYSGRPWLEGTLRIFHDDDRQRWSVTLKGDPMYGTSWISWYDHGGEIFHEGRWIKLKGGLGEQG